jgi:opacity protein-like surface antigen
MKKLIIAAIILCSTVFSVKAQHISLTGFGGYNFQDKVQFSGAWGYVKEGGFWGASIEGVNAHGHGVELLYQEQHTSVPLYFYSGGNNQINKDNDQAAVSYIMLNGVQYLMQNPKVMPYGGLGIGMAIVKATETGNSQTKFAWDAKLGIKLRASSSIAIKIQTQLYSISQCTGGGFYVGTGGGGVGVSSYSTVFQFGFMGGLCIDLAKH